MRVFTNQEESLADGMVCIPSSELDHLSSLIEWSLIKKRLSFIKTDYSALSLFKILLLQTWYNLSDAAISNALHRDLVFMKFCRFSLDGKKPDAATICRFRKKLIAGQCLDELLLLINSSLEQQGMILSQGKYVSSDATLIQSARRPRKQLSSKQNQSGEYQVDQVEYSDDKQASWLKKGKAVIYGYSATVMTDEQGLVLSVNTHPANVSEMTRFSQDIECSRVKEGQRVLYDKGVSSQANRAYLASAKLKDGIMHKKPRGKDLSYWSRLRNKLIGSKRFVTERTFGTLKRVYGLHRARYVGVQKVQAEVLLKSMAYNLKRAMNLKANCLRQEQCV